MTDYYETKSQPINRLMVWQAYKKVKANKGSAGIDEMSFEDLDKDLSQHLYKLWNRMTSGSYFPPPVREVPIKKKDGGIRKLGIPTILDRIAQQVVKAYLEPQVEPYFHNSSYGYRPKRNQHQAIEAAYRNSNGNDWAIDLDIKGFFDNIDHELLMKGVAYFCKESWVLLYVKRWLQAGVIQKDGAYINRESGTPQGGVISPLLANIYLHITFDKWMEREHPNNPFERFADDIVIHCKKEKQAQQICKEVSDRLEDCKLKIHPKKTEVINLRGKSKNKYSRKYDFLGFTFKPTWVKTKVGFKVMIVPRMSNQSMKRINERIRNMRLHKWRKPIDYIADELRPILRGVINYYCKISKNDTYLFWRGVNERILKWVKWEKGLRQHNAIKWLRTKWKENPNLFPHWALVHP